MASNMGSHMMTPTSSASKDPRSPQFPTGGNASILLEKAKIGLRRSTPDSEALASSDDEQDPNRHLTRITSQPLPKPARRPSWINENPRAANRKSSIGTPGLGMDAVSPGPAVDATGWGSAGSPLARVNSNGNSFPWGNAIWSSDGAKAPPARLSEMTPGVYAESEHGSNFDEPLRSPALRRDSTAGGAIPFAIPLKPTLKAYRSQSYSVGQMEQEQIEAAQARQQQQQAYNGRTRAPGVYANLQTRGSRPSMMGDSFHDGGMLEQLREVDDDEESFNSTGSQPQFPTETRSREQLERENALLRENNDLRQQLVNMSISAQGGGRPGLSEQQNTFAGRRGTFSDAVLEDAEELGEDIANLGHYTVPLGRSGRRMSEYNGGGVGHTAMGGHPSNRAIDAVKRNHWQSSLGFGGSQEQPQSRRHSFADVPKRQVSLGSIGGEYPAAELGRGAQGGALTAERGYPSQAYGQPRTMTSAELAQQSMSSMSSHLSSPPPTRYGGQPHGFDHMSPRNQSLYLVTFKASRAEFYYVPQGVGLEIKAGDLVIVEADRGTDLGTVVQTMVPWSQIKHFKDHYAEEHYRWLMMFSRRRAEGGNLGPNPGAVSPANGRDGHALTKDESDIRPKMIKRLAQAHEIQNLKDKEANEAKAKRICQVKADEHQLDMEILDAEFQMDWKKLTFYYYADSYINFNSLVTDLFKTYKTRIWMSAINPASFMTPTSMAPPAVIGPGAILAPGDPRNAAATTGRGPSGSTSRSNLASPIGSTLHGDAAPYWSQQQQAHQNLQQGPTSMPYYDNSNAQRDEQDFLRLGNRGVTATGPDRDQQHAFGHHGSDSAYGSMPPSMYGGLGMNGNGIY